MIQLIVAGLVALALVASIWKFGDHMADARELDVRAQYAAAAETQRKTDEAAQAALRAWALQLSRNYLKFGSDQEKLFKGVGDDLAKQIANDPAMRRVCMDAVGVSGFNRPTTGLEGRALPAPSARDDSVRRDSAAPSR